VLIDRPGKPVGYDAPVTYRDDGDALLARNAALEAENEQLRRENDHLKQPPEPVALQRTTPQQMQVQPERTPWWRHGYTIVLYIAAIAIAIWQGLLS
jgi:hypothetical protein